MVCVAEKMDVMEDTQPSFTYKTAFLSLMPLQDCQEKATNVNSFTKKKCE
jgi:hypothetical protein